MTDSAEITDPADLWDAYLTETDNPSPQGAMAFTAAWYETKLAGTGDAAQGQSGCGDPGCKDPHCTYGNDEPIAWRVTDGEGDYDYRTEEPSADVRAWSARYGRQHEPLYAAPQPASNAGDNTLKDIAGVVEHVAFNGNDWDQPSALSIRTAQAIIASVPALHDVAYAPSVDAETLRIKIARVICCPDGCMQERNPDFSGKGCYTQRDTYKFSNVGKSTEQIMAAITSSMSSTHQNSGAK